MKPTPRRLYRLVNISGSVGIIGRLACALLLLLVTVNASAQTLPLTPSMGTQLVTTFTVTGAEYTPNGTVRRFVNQSTWGGYREISSIQANSVGQINFPYTPNCTHPARFQSTILMSVLMKSSPLNKSGSPVSVASAYENQSP